MRPDPELQRLRTAMDAVNRQLVDVLHERARLSRAIGRWKRAHGIPAADPVREQAMLDDLLHQVPADGFTRESLATLLRAVFAASRAIVENERI